MKGIIDSKSFLFSFTQLIPKKFDLVNSNTQKSIFFLFHQNDKELFTFGQNELYVYKKGMKSYCCQNKESLFNYQNCENVFINSQEKCQQVQFSVQRIVVVELKECDELDSKMIFIH